MTRSSAVIKYDGKRGAVCRIKFRDADASRSWRRSAGKQTAG
jgi:hypothetical protein